MLKREIRILEIEDAPFKKFIDKESLIVGTIFRGGSFLDGIISAKAAVDGNDSTENIIRMITKSKFYEQIRCILLDGIAVAGFNVIDIQELSDKTKIPVIVIIRRYPDIEKIKSTLIKIHKQEKISLIEKAGEIEKINSIYIQKKNLSIEKAREILNMTCTHSNIPEPLRQAHLIASGIVLGESKGRA